PRAEPADRAADGGLGRMTTQEVSGLAPELAGAKAGTGLKPIASAGERFTSYDLEAFEVPSGREENWRFTPMRRLHGLHSVEPDAVGDLVDGTAHVSVEAGDGVTVETVALTDERVGEAGAPADRIAALAWSRSTEAHLLTLDGSAAPVTVTVNGPGEGRVALAHLHLRTTPHAEAVVVLDYRGGGTLADNLEVVLADGSTLTLVVIDDWDDDAVHVGGQHLLAGLSFADADQHLEHRLLVDHAAPHCRSNVVYKSALQGEAAHTVWIGDVLIRAEAEGTDTYELNRNLLLTEGARADSVPNLEIETGEIAGAGHASATGRFDDEQLFYLRSRGIPEADARRLVVRGFFNEIINKIGIVEVRERLEAAVEAELAASDLA